jgi:peptide/nickel transport system substrate-binding protein
MRRKLLLSATMLVVGAALLAAASLASAASSGPSHTVAGPKKGGTLRVSFSTDIDYLDPALAYFTNTWEAEYITCSRLFYYPDVSGAQGTQLQPEVVKSYTVSKDGKTYTFNLWNTFRYNTGRTVQAADFVEALNRDADPTMQSPATQYMHEIVGADAVINGGSGAPKTISGVRAVSKFVLQLKLSKPVVDMTARLATPFFCPLPPGTARDSAGIGNPPGDGPYYVASFDRNRQYVFKRNPNYTGKRPHNLDQIVWTIGTSLEACELETVQNVIDYCGDGIPATDYGQVATKYGINKPNGQFFFYPVLGTRFYEMNFDRPAFKNNFQLRKAINYAIDRPALVRAGGYLSGKRTDQILPASMTTPYNIYPLKGANAAQAKKIAAGHMPAGNSLVLYDANRGAYVTRAQIFQYNLKQMGINVSIQQFSRAVEAEKCGVKGEPFDVCENAWLVDYPDPVTYFVPLLDGNSIQATNNNNHSYFNDPKWNNAIESAGKLTGAARRNAYIGLDHNITQQVSPWASFLTLTNRDFVSKSTGCYLFQPVFLMDWGVTCKK